MKRYFIYLFGLTLLFSLACSNKTSNPNPTPNTTTNQPPSIQKTEIKPVVNEEHVPKPALDGKTAMGVFNHLKTKGWQLNDAKIVEIAPFGSEEAVGFSRSDRVGFLVLRFESLDAAQAKFSQIDGIYRNKFGRAVTAKNFVVGIFGGQKKINSPDFNQLSEEEYIKLQEHLVEFCNL